MTGPSKRKNIECGNKERIVSVEEVIDVARKANIHEFISALSEGYETRVGGHVDPNRLEVKSKGWPWLGC